MTGRSGGPTEGSSNVSPNERSVDSPRPADRPRPPATEPDATRSRPTPPAGRDAGDSWSREGPNLVAVLASTAGFEAVAWVVLRYVPEYLRTLGVGAPAIGAFGSLWLLGRWLAGDRVRPRPLWIVLGAVAAAVGLTLWALLPALAGASAANAWALLLVGAVGMAAWSRVGTRRTVDRWPLGRVNGTVCPDRTGWTVAALVVTLTVLALARSFQAGFRALLALAAALGVTVAALWAVGDLDVTLPDRETSERRANPTLGDVVSQFGLAMVSMFVVVAVTGVLEVGVTVMGRRLGPAAAFGLFLAAELTTAAAVTRVGPRLVDVVGTRAAGIYASVVAAAFPLLLVSAPANPAVVGAVFVAYGTRAIGRVAGRRADARASGPDVPLGRGGSDDGRGGPVVDGGNERVPDSGNDHVADSENLPARTTDRPVVLVTDRLALVVVAAPLVGGLLYAASPVLAFGSATAVGTIGAWERVRTAAAP